MKKIIYVLAGLSLLVFNTTLTNSKPTEASDRLTLSDRNTVVLNLPIDGDVARQVQTDLLAKSDKLSHNEPIYLVLNSPGGSVSDGQAIVQVAKSLPQQVHTVTIFGASMAFMIAQQLGTRYVLLDTTMMSHHAYTEGVGGNVPGSLMSRTQSLYNGILELQKRVAERAGYELENYDQMITHELWMSGKQAVDFRFADKVVDVYCDKTLRGNGPAKQVRFLIFNFSVAFSKCPLITTPQFVDGEKEGMQLFTDPKGDIVNKINHINF